MVGSSTSSGMQHGLVATCRSPGTYFLLVQFHMQSQRKNLKGKIEEIDRRLKLRKLEDGDCRFIKERLARWADFLGNFY